MKTTLVALAMVGMAGCAGHEAHINTPAAQVDYYKTGNGSTSYWYDAKPGSMYPGVIPVFDGNVDPTGRTPGTIVRLPGTSEGMAAMESLGASPFILLQQPETVGLAPNGALCADCLTTSDLDPIIGQFDNHEGRIRALETTNKKGSGNAQPKKKGEPQ